MTVKTGNGKHLAVLGNQYRLHTEQKTNSYICCCSEKQVYYNKNERLIEVSITVKEYSDLAKRIEDSFTEIDNDIIVDLRKQDGNYLSLCRQIGDMDGKYPFILNVIEGEGDISLTVEEHKILVEYFSLILKKDNIERKQIYFRGHTDGYAYLKKIGAV